MYSKITLHHTHTHYTWRRRHKEFLDNEVLIHSSPQFGASIMQNLQAKKKKKTQSNLTQSNRKRLPSPNNAAAMHNN